MNKDLTVERVSHADSRRKGVLSRRGSAPEAPKPQAGESLELLEKPEEARKSAARGGGGCRGHRGTESGDGTGSQDLQDPGPFSE